MDFKSKASITLTGIMSAAAVLAAVRGLPGFDEAVLSAAQAEAEASKSATSLTLADRQITFADDGSATVDLVYEKVEAVVMASADQGAAQAEQPAQDAPLAAIVPLALQTLVAAGAGA